MNTPNKDAWKILIVDDEKDVHKITQIALRSRTWRGKGFEITSAFSAKEAEDIFDLTNSSPFQVAIIDVIMETDHAGLDLCHLIRSRFGASVRIILRTGQPGMAPEEQVLETYDIDYYLSKAEANESQLFAAIRVCLRAAEDISALEDSNTILTVTNAELNRHALLSKEIVNALNPHEQHILAEAFSGEKNSNEDRAKSQAVISILADQLKSTIKSNDFYEKLESAIAEKRILILLKNRKALSITQGVLAGTSSSPETAENWTEAMNRLKEGQIDLVYLDWENLGILSEAISYNPRLLAVLLTTQPLFEEHGRVIMNLPIASAVVVSSLANSEGEIDPLTVQEIVVTAGKLISGDIFGIEKYLSWGAKIHEVKLISSEQRSEILDTVDEFAKSCQLRRSFRSKVVTLTDELLMNAIWDAPIDQQGNPKYDKAARNIPIQLKPSEHVILKYASDGNYLAISVTDNFGRLTRETAFQYLLRCFQKSSDQINQGEGGAGLGLYMAYLAITSLVINVIPNKKTEVIGILNLRLSKREIATRARAFHYFCRR